MRGKGPNLHISAIRKDILRSRTTPSLSTQPCMIAVTAKRGSEPVRKGPLLLLPRRERPVKTAPLRQSDGRGRERNRQSGQRSNSESCGHTLLLFLRSLFHLQHPVLHKGGSFQTAGLIWRICGPWNFGVASRRSSRLDVISSRKRRRSSIT